MVDFHTHLGHWGLTDEPAVDEDELLRRADEFGVDRFVILPLGMTPECFMVGGDNEAVLEAYRRHPDRVIPFCNIDPRSANAPDTDFSWVLGEFKAAGCKGLGEVTANIPFDHPLCMNLYRHCGRVGFPLLFHLASAVAYPLYGVADEMGMPRLERALKECPETTFVGHAMAFWSEIASNVDEATRGGYPDGKVEGPGRTVQLLKQYPNLYADLSAGSGFNAISRDPEFGYWFFEECQDKLLFATDICHVNQPVDIVPYIKAARADGHFSEIAYSRITQKNAERLLGV